MTTKNFITILLCCLCCIPIQSYAQHRTFNYTVKTVPNVKQKNKNAYTSDPQNILGSRWVVQLDSLAAAIKAEKGAEVAIVVLPKISNDYANAREFAHELFNYWGIGEKGKDNGLLLLLITDKNNRKIVFEVGYGLEGTLPDGLCKLIQKRVMIPLMKEGNYGAGLVAGVQEIQKILNNSSDLKSEYKYISFFDKIWDNIWYIIGFILLIFFNIALWDDQKKEITNWANTGEKDPYLRYIHVLPDRKFPSIGTLFSNILVYLLYILFLPVVIMSVILRYRMRKKLKNEIICENCKTAGSNKVINSDTKSDEDSNLMITTWTFKCSKCGHEHQALEKCDLPDFTEEFVMGASDCDDSDDDSDDYDSSDDWGGGSSGGRGA